ncbi:MAG TPA: 4Fe-4S binding protein, partial [Deferrisomatales bacterium]|nr:4Fe-4S binding protein [Deferrisomatales bacterium]
KVLLCFARTHPGLVLRRTTQFAVAALVLLAAWEFSAFVEALRAGPPVGALARPPVVEGFLPIAAIVALRGFLATGQFDPVHPAGLTLLLATLATAWLFRRTLCSWVCPLGTLSEGLGWLGRKLMGRNLAVPRWADIGLLVAKYAVFAFAFKVFFLMPTAQALAFLRTPYYAVSDIKMFDLFARIGPVGLGVVGALVVLSILIRSFWCRYLCPYGALLGVLGLLSPVALVRDAETCIHCHKCNRACPNGVDVEGARRCVVSAECTGCTRCAAVCPVDGTLRFRLLGLATLRPVVLSISFLSLFFGAVVWAKASGHWESSVDARQLYRLDAVMSRQRPSG